MAETKWLGVWGRDCNIVEGSGWRVGTLGSESECSSTELSWDLYVKGWDNVFNVKGRANEIGQSWCPAELLDF